MLFYSHLVEYFIWLVSIKKLYYLIQRAKKVVSDSPGLVDFAIGRVIFVPNLPSGQV